MTIVDSVTEEATTEMGVPRERSSLSLRVVRALDGEEVARLLAGPDEVVHRLKEVIAAKVGAASASLWLLHGGHLLEDQLTLGESGVSMRKDDIAPDVELQVVEDSFPPGFPKVLQRTVLRFRQRQQAGSQSVPGRLRREGRALGCLCAHRGVASKVTEPERRSPAAAAEPRRSYSADLSDDVVETPPVSPPAQAPVVLLGSLNRQPLGKIVE